MARPKKKTKDKFKRITITIDPVVYRILNRKKNKSQYISDLILLKEVE